MNSLESPEMADLGSIRSFGGHPIGLFSGGCVYKLSCSLQMAHSRWSAQLSDLLVWQCICYPLGSLSLVLFCVSLFTIFEGPGVWERQWLAGLDWLCAKLKPAWLIGELLSLYWWPGLLTSIFCFIFVGRCLSVRWNGCPRTVKLVRNGRKTNQKKKNIPGIWIWVWLMFTFMAPSWHVSSDKGGLSGGSWELLSVPILMNK